ALTVTVARTADCAFGLIVDAPRVTMFGGAVGSGTPLPTLTTDAGGRTAVPGGAITTAGTATGGQTYNDEVRLLASTTLAAGAGGVKMAGQAGGEFFG